MQEQAVEAYRTAGDRAGLAHAVRHVGDLFTELGEHAAAEPYYDEMQSLYATCADAPPNDLANASRSLAVHYEALGRTEEAIDAWNDARERYQIGNVDAGVSEADQHLIALG